ncbi:MAG TPA: HPF/RaiA family ribosome-associated protein [Gemmataceae bacterium]|nr:HPF/RaiA family ribosome-associated protein [Gemmataceae bacterium]
MKPTDRRTDFPIQIDARHCTIRPAMNAKMHEGAEVLRRQVEQFPIASLHVLIEHNARNNNHTVKTDLFLNNETLVCSDHDLLAYTAYERCIQALAAEVERYKARLGQDAERQKTEKATHQTVRPTALPDAAAIEAAVRDGDYATFRTATFVYEEPVRKRAGRWIERYPEAEAQIDRQLKMADIVEEVFLNAFENYGRRPEGVRFGEWLEDQIDHAVKELLRRPDAELENIALARTARAAKKGMEAV